MADNAIEKLFEEMRAARAEVQEASFDVPVFGGGVGPERERLRKARERERLLANALDKHIFEQVPVLQAKMIAHEEQGELDSTMIVAGSITATRIAAGSILSTKLNVRQFGPKQSI